MPGHADAIQKGQGLAIAAGNDVLAVVDAFSRDGIAKRSGPAAEMRARLDDMNTRTGLDERRRRGKPGEAAADHDDVGLVGRVGRAGLVKTGRVRSRRSEEHTSELQSLRHLVCRLLLEKK